MLNVFDYDHSLAFCSLLDLLLVLLFMQYPTWYLLSRSLNGDLILLTHAFTCIAHKIYRLLHSTGLVLKYTNTRIHLDTIQFDTYCTKFVSMHARTQP